MRQAILFFLLLQPVGVLSEHERATERLFGVVQTCQPAVAEDADQAFVLAKLSIVCITLSFGQVRSRKKNNETGTSAKDVIE